MSDSPRVASFGQQRRLSARRTLGSELDIGKDRIQWFRQATEVDRVREQARVAELALRTHAKEAACLRVLGFPPPRGLALHSPERAEAAVSGEEFLYQCAASRPDEFFL